MKELHALNYVTTLNGVRQTINGYIELDENHEHGIRTDRRSNRIIVRDFCGVHVDPETNATHLTAGSIDKFQQGGQILDFWELQGGDNALPILHYVTQNESGKYAGSGQSIDTRDYFTVGDDYHTMVTDFHKIDENSPEYDTAAAAIGTFSDELAKMSTRMLLALDDELKTRADAIKLLKSSRKKSRLRPGLLRAHQRLRVNNRRESVRV